MKHKKKPPLDPGFVKFVIFALTCLAVIVGMGANAFGSDRAGDANGDGACNVGDAVYTINYVFKDGPPPVPLEYATAEQMDDVLRILASMAVTWPVPGAYEFVYVDSQGVFYLYNREDSL